MTGFNPKGHRHRGKKGQTRHDRAVKRVAADKTPKAWLDPETFYAIPQEKSKP